MRNPLTPVGQRRPRSLYQLHVLPFLGDLARGRRRACTLDDIPDAMLDRLVELGFDALWLVGVWDRGELARSLVRADVARMEALRHHVPDLKDSEILSSPFSVRAYEVSAEIGGLAALARLRERLNQRGLKLVLDWIVNHVGRDSAWVYDHPEAFVRADPEALPDGDDFFRAPTCRGRFNIAYGRDPYFPGWPETAQLDARSQAARALLTQSLLAVADLCDGIQCHMAMLGLGDVFNSTWPQPGWLPPEEPAEGELWAELIGALRGRYPGFWLLAEAYWGREWDLQELGFSHTYDKTFYDRLRDGDAASIRAHLQGNLAYQARAVRFLENHFQDRAAAVFRGDRYRAAAALVGGAPGVRMFVQGQLQGRRERLPLELGCHPPEPADPVLEAFYERLCRAINHPAVLQGQWRLLGDEMPQQDQALDAIFVMRWHHDLHGTLLFVINFSDAPACPRVPVDRLDCDQSSLELVDLLGGGALVGSGREALGPGIAVELEPWGARVFEVHRDGP